MFSEEPSAAPGGHVQRSQTLTKTESPQARTAIDDGVNALLQMVCDIHEADVALLVPLERGVVWGEGPCPLRRALEAWARQLPAGLRRSAQDVARANPLRGTDTTDPLAPPGVLALAEPVWATPGRQSGWLVVGWRTHDAAGVARGLQHLAHQAAQWLNAGDAFAETAKRARTLEAAQAERISWIRHVVHDFKSPLASIMANSGFLDAEIQTADEDLSGALEDVKVQAGRLLDMTHDLLDVAKEGAQAMQVNPSRITLDALFQDVEQATRVLAAQHGKTIRAQGRHPWAPSALAADQALLQRVIRNLVDNALKYAHGGSHVELSARLDPSGDIVLEVSDDGPGLPDELAERIFDAGTQAEPGTGTGNHGLGLAFCRIAAEAHGGAIWAENRRDGGARFSVRLPGPGRWFDIPDDG